MKNRPTRRVYSEAANKDCWALGEQTRNGFKVRRVVWGLLLAAAERRETEEIRRAVILVGVHKP